MTKSDETATVSKINDPAPKTGGASAKKSDPERRTVAPTPTVAAKEAGARAKGTTTEDEGVVEAAREAAAERAESVKRQAADVTREHAENFEEASESFDPDSYARVATDRLAEGLNEAAQSIQNADFNALSRDLATFARRQPLMFFGGAALLGFAAGRLIKASERAEHDYPGYS